MQNNLAFEQRRCQVKEQIKQIKEQIVVKKQIECT